MGDVCGHMTSRPVYVTFRSTSLPCVCVCVCVSVCVCVCVCPSIQAKAKEAGLWNLFLPAVSGLSQLDYAHIAEQTGRCFYAPEVFNCQAPGNTTTNY